MKKLLLIIFILLPVHHSLAQADQQWLQKKFSISAAEVSIAEVLKQLEKEMEGVVFAYSPSTFDVKRTVSIEAKEKPLLEILQELFRGKDLKVTKMRGKVFLMKKKSTSSKQSSSGITKRRSLSRSIANVPTAQDSTGSKVSQPPQASSKALEKTAKKPQEFSEKEVKSTINQIVDQPEVDRREAALADEPQHVPELVKAEPSAISASKTRHKPVQPIKINESKRFDLYEYEQTLVSKPKLLPIPVDTSLIKNVDAEAAKKQKAVQKKEKKEKTPREPEEKKFRFYVAPTSSLTHIDGDLGIKVGGRVVWLKSSRFGIGLSGSALAGELINDPVLNSNYRVAGGYGGLFLEYNLQPHKRLHLSFPVTFALGAVTYMQQGLTTQPTNLIEDQRVVGLLEPGIMVELNVWKYIKVGFELNYRYTTFSELNYTDTGGIILNGSGLNGFSGGLTLKLGIF